MRAFLSVLFVLFFFHTGPAHAFGVDCPIFWQGFLLPQAAEPVEAPPSGTSALFAFTVIPPAGAYLYGPESSEGLPTKLVLKYAHLDAFPMKAFTDKEIMSLMQSQGKTLEIQEPKAIEKKKTIFAEMIFPGGQDTNPPIYSGPVTFWAEIPLPHSGLGGLIFQVELSGLLCSAASCTPATGTQYGALSSREATALPAADMQDWWPGWVAGEQPVLPVPEGKDEKPAVGEGAFTGGKSLSVPRNANNQVSLLQEQNWKDHFAFLSPVFFHASLEVQYLGQALLLGLAAGLLLNLMPCVLPVVSLKFSALMAVSAMTNRRKQAKAFRAHCVVFALGIMTWFAILALLLGLAGWAWGELFQQPTILVILGLILFMLGLSLFGVFSLPLFDLKVTNTQYPHWQAFASGLLATLLATPCSGPLLGGVLAWAIRQPLPALILTIGSIGLGMSLPYVLMAFRPGLVHLLPRPGSWTIRLEQLLGFFLMGSVIYLATLLPMEWMPAFLFNLLTIALAAWLWGQIGHLRASVFRRTVSRCLAVAVVILGGWLGVTSVQADATWEKFEPASFSRMLGKEPLLVEFTADWCPSCKALEHTTLNSNRMNTLRRRYNMRTIRVDLTREAEAGKELLRALDSTSIPVIALFPAGTNASRPLVLRDLVTPKQLEEAMAKVF